MSYNFYAEGELDYFSLAQEAQRFTKIELFPIAGDGGADALGIGIPSWRADERAVAELTTLLTRLLAQQAVIVDLMSGRYIVAVDDLPALADRICPRK